MKFKALFLSLLIIFVFQGAGFALFKKKYNQEDEVELPMVHTVQEWLESAQSVNMDLRKEDNEQKRDEKLTPTAEIPSYITRYNVQAGSKEVNLSELLKNKIVRSNLVASPDFSHIGYTETYYFPQTKQVRGAFYLIEPDSNLTRKDKLLKTNIFEHRRSATISTKLIGLKNNLFSSFTIVDFSKNGKMIALKEKRGSTKYGIYETYVWIYFIDENDKNNNPCYTNNLDMKEISNDFGYSDETKSDFDNAADSANDISNNSSENNSAENKNNQSENINENTNSKSASNNTSLGTTEDKISSNWMVESNTNVDKLPAGAKYGIKEEDIPKLNPSDLKNFIKASWKEQELSSGITERWYNHMPYDFSVKDPYNEPSKIGYGVRLNLLNAFIKAYWFDRKDLILNHIRWDLRPLGFNAKNSDEFIVYAFAFDKNGKEVSLGRFGVNTKDGLPRVISDEEDISIESNALTIEKRLEAK